MTVTAVGPDVGDQSSFAFGRGAVGYRHGHRLTGQPERRRIQLAFVVDLSCDRFKMRGVDAFLDGADVIEIEPGRDRADHRLIGPPMRNHAPYFRAILRDKEGSVAGTAARARPDPAFLGRGRRDLCPEAIGV